MNNPVKFPPGRGNEGPVLPGEASDPSRRNFLKALAALGASALLPSGRLAAQAPGAKARAIDCHHHFVSPAYIKALTAKEGRHIQGYTTWFGLSTLKDYSPAKDIEDMNGQDVTTSMLSCTTPGAWFGDPEETSRLTREMNEFGARMVADYKGRFGLFAMLPLPIIENSLREIEYAFDTLHADGVGLMSSYDNHWLGDTVFRPVFDELNRRKAVVYVHPIDASCCQDIMLGVNPTTIEYNTDTARTIFSLLAAGAAGRYADIRFLFSHAGGTMPSLVERFGIGAADTIADNLAGPAEPDSRLYHLRRFYYDTAQSTNPVQMQGLKMIVGASQIVFGSDYPFSAGPAKHLRGLQKCGFSAEELGSIQRGTAERLFPRLKA
jgi:predicted TIM-barrel fold metal-dependent hydrolase